MVEQWPDDPSQATPDRAAIEGIVRRATWYKVRPSCSYGQSGNEGGWLRTPLPLRS